MTRFDIILQKNYLYTLCETSIKVILFISPLCLFSIRFYTHIHCHIYNNFPSKSYKISWLSKNPNPVMLFKDPLSHYESPPTFKSYSLYHSLRIKRWFFTSILYISYLIITDGNDIVITKSSLYSNALTYMYQYSEYR